MIRIVDYLARQLPTLEAFILRHPGWAAVILAFIGCALWRAARAYVVWLVRRYSSRLPEQLSTSERNLNAAIRRLARQLDAMEEAVARQRNPPVDALAINLPRPAPPQPRPAIPPLLLKGRKKPPKKGNDAPSPDKTVYDRLLDDDDPV